MRRGFLTVSKADKKANADIRSNIGVKGAADNELADELAELVEQQLEVRRAPLITLPKFRDVTFVFRQANPHILRADWRLPIPSPYIIYLPPSAVPGDAELAIVENDIGNLASWLKGWNKQAMRIETADRSFEIANIPGKGLVMIALRDVRKGEVIYAERPLFITSKVVNRASDDTDQMAYMQRATLSRLNIAQQEALMALSACHPAAERHEVHSRIGTNALAAYFKKSNAEEETHVAVFATLSRANHSCATNTNYVFKSNDLTGRFYAARDISTGEEITTGYTDAAEPTAERQAHLLESYGFTCSCEICSLPAAERQESDRNRKYIAYIYDLLGGLIKAPRPSVDDCNKALHLCSQERLYSHRMIILRGAARLFGRDKIAEATEWGLEAKQAFIDLTGEEDQLLHKRSHAAHERDSKIIEQPKFAAIF